MKRKILIVITILCFGLFSCENWLDVSPKTEVKATDLFQTENGFKDALIGVYIGMSDAGAYGKTLTWHVMENQGQQYNHSTNSKYKALQRFNYEDATSVSIIEGVWQKQYRIISEANSLLQGLETNGSILSPTLFNLIKGEALALRSYVHFDLMRIYGYGNFEGNPENFDKHTIPYKNKTSKELTPSKTYTETFELLEADINEALELLKTADPSYPENTHRLSDFDQVYNNHLEGDQRMFRLNYIALKALQARVYLWQGKKEQALAAAEYVIEYANVGWATETSSGVFYEQLFALDVQNLADLMFGYYDSHINWGQYNSDRLNHYRRSIFDEYGESASDLRFLEGYEKIGWSNYITVKLRTTAEVLGLNKSSIPLIRIPEMYLIAAECYNDDGSTNDATKAIEYINFLKQKRNIMPGYYLAEGSSSNAIKSAIQKEYTREFIQEGQLFYFYKRKGLTSFQHSPSGVEMTDDQYRFPYPDLEIDLGLIQD